MTHLGHLPDIGRWLLWIAVNIVVGVLAVIGVWFVYKVVTWKYGRRGGKR